MIDEHNVGRRQFLVGLGAAGTTLAGCQTTQQTPHGWIDVDTPTRMGLTDAVMSVDGPFAVGESGLVLTRNGDAWEAVVSDGPTGGENPLAAVDATDDGRYLWLCGSSGVVGRYDVRGGSVTDLSAPRQKTSSWTDVAVSGRANGETVYLINSSGELLTGHWSNGRVRWRETVTKPTGGESASAVDVADGTVYVVDTGGTVVRNSGSRWTPIGIRGAEGGLTDIAAIDGNHADATADDGSIFVYNGYNWLQLHASEKTLHAVDRMGGRGLAVGNSGDIFALEENNWTKEPTDTPKTLQGCALGRDTYSDVAVGSDGTILERFG
ncbi:MULTISPECIES: hypothetical protein [Halomicrobium]|uniref:Uncharacterized protein n=2 Tax=Halomicrobium mukohataei TaxID=57705 RepID=C7P142_HALMD|nr:MULTISPECIES: hypothetical protein [Halomicrobium]ACV49057.1 conserved hypothetical protein [Halomicrobium mukohataei DSM 12286]QCD64477.1 hypothetical protein E5139_02045 [Halomicrobium mukohataei]QFR19283.1 hypothetical protein GBQ70_02045 [Halomicrobium sp. ZPS1]